MLTVTEKQSEQNIFFLNPECLTHRDGADSL